MSKQLIFMLGLALGCGAAQSQVPGTEAWHAVADARGVQVINVECGANFIDPPEIVVKSNRRVELLVRTSEPLQEFVSDFSTGKAIGKQRTLYSFTPTAQGQSKLVCQKQGGAEALSIKAKKSGRLTVVQDNGKN